MRFIYLAMVLTLSLFVSACGGGEAEEADIPSVTFSTEESNDTPEPTQILTTAQVSVETPAPTQVEISEWGNCRGIVQEAGDQLVRAVEGEQFCIVSHSGIGTFVSIWPTNLNEAENVAQEAASFLTEPCAVNVSYFISPDLGITSFPVKELVCDR